jgi:uncharacterized protein DUF4411
MKRHYRPPLFRATEPDVYEIDTSAWLNVDSRADSEEVWRSIIALINEGRVVSCAQVLSEMRDNPLYLTRLKPYEAALQAGDRNADDPQYLLHVGKITHAYPAMCKARGEKTPADPYVVALAELEGYVVVADETCRKRPNRKIPGVCQQRKIRCITLSLFVEEIRATTAEPQPQEEITK